MPDGELNPADEQIVRLPELVRIAKGIEPVEI
jgi:hypothetical protein